MTDRKVPVSAAQRGLRPATEDHSDSYNYHLDPGADAVLTGASISRRTTQHAWKRDLGGAMAKGQSHGLGFGCGSIIDYGNGVIEYRQTGKIIPAFRVNIA